jgi:AcrR family transcriptional regulator
LPPDERRAAIVAAALPLLLERGPNVTTRQIAEAAGVAEGTIFRAFADKDALVSAVVEAALDTSSLEAAITAIDAGQPLERQLEAAVELLQRRHADIWRLLSAIDDMAAMPGRRKPRPMADLASLIALFERHPGRLRLDPVRAARTLRSLTLATSHPSLNPHGPMSPAETVGLLLDGIRTWSDDHHADDHHAEDQNTDDQDADGMGPRAAARGGAC